MFYLPMNDNYSEHFAHVCVCWRALVWMGTCVFDDCYAITLLTITVE